MRASQTWQALMRLFIDEALSDFHDSGLCEESCPCDKSLRFTRQVAYIYFTTAHLFHKSTSAVDQGASRAFLAADKNDEFEVGAEVGFVAGVDGPVGMSCGSTEGVLERNGSSD